MPFRDAIESIREELEKPSAAGSLAERTSAIVGAALVFLGKRQVIASVVVVVIALLATAVVTGARGWGEPDQTIAPASTPATSESGSVTRFATPVSLTTPDRVNSSVAAPANVVSKTPAPRPRVAEERGTPKKATEQKPDTRKIAIPGYQTTMMSRLDSVASSAANTSSQATESALQPGPVSFGNQRTLFEGTDQSMPPQRARLIGELPTPRVPPNLANIEGVVRIRFNVDAEGRPVISTMTVVASPNPLLTSAVRTVVPRIRFEPARSSGPDSKPIGDVVEIGFQFSRRN